MSHRSESVLNSVRRWAIPACIALLCVLGPSERSGLQAQSTESQTDPIVAAEQLLVAGGRIVGPAIPLSGGSVILFAAEDRRLYGVSPDARERFRVSLPGRPIAVAQVTGSTVAVLVFPGQVLLFNAAGEEVWRRELSGSSAVDLAVAAGNRILVLSRDRLRALSLSGRLLWELPTRGEWSELVPTAAGKLPPPVVWLSDDSGRYLAIEADGRRRISFTVGTGGEVHALGSQLLVRGPSGSVDIVDQGGSVRRIAQSGVSVWRELPAGFLLSGPGALVRTPVSGPPDFAVVPRLIGVRSIGGNLNSGSGSEEGSIAPVIALHGPAGELSLISATSGSEAARLILDPPGTGAVLESLLYAGIGGGEWSLLVWTEDWALRRYTGSLAGNLGNTRGTRSAGDEPATALAKPSGSPASVNQDVSRRLGLFPLESPRASDARSWRELPDLAVLVSAMERGSPEVQERTLAGYRLPDDPAARRGVAESLSSLLLGRWDLLGSAARVEAARLLGDLGDGGAVRGLTERIRGEPDASVVRAGLLAISSAGGDSSVWDAVARTARRDDLPAELVELALLVLADLRWFRGPQAVAEIAEILAAQLQNGRIRSQPGGRAGERLSVSEALQARLTTPRYGL